MPIVTMTGRHQPETCMSASLSPPRKGTDPPAASMCGLSEAVASGHAGQALHGTAMRVHTMRSEIVSVKSITHQLARSLGQASLSSSVASPGTLFRSQGFDEAVLELQ